MDQNEWHSWHNPSRQSSERRPYYQSNPEYAPPPRPRLPTETLNEKFIQVERKLLTVSLKENTRGRFLCIAEETNDRFNSVVIPDAGLEDLHTVINEMVRTSKSIPLKDPHSAPPGE
jgi:hypothetical protein